MTPKKKLLALQKLRGLVSQQKKQVVSAASVVGTILSAWCAEKFPDLPSPPIAKSRKLATNPVVKDFVSFLVALPLLESSYWLSSAYALMKQDDYRRKMAMFFTPPSLAHGLLADLEREGVNFATQTFLDPACGGAAFLVPIAQRIRITLAAKGYQPLAILQHAEAHLFGTDLDKTLCSLSRQFLWMVYYEEIRAANYRPVLLIHRANSLVELHPLFGRIDVVVCNPPYRKMTGSEVRKLNRNFADVIEAQPNLYGLFIVLCSRLMRDGGIGAVVTPTSFLSGQYFSKVRKFLLRKCRIAHIGVVHEKSGVFIDVEQETALTIIQNQENPQATPVQTRISAVSSRGKYKAVGTCTLPSSGSAWMIPRSVGDASFLRIAGRSRFRLADYGYRPRIGAYVWNRDERPCFETISDVRKAKAIDALPLVWASNISSSGTLKFDERIMLNGEHRFVDFGDKKHPSAITRKSIVLQRVTSKDQTRRLVAAPVPRKLMSKYGAFVAENHVVVLEQDAAKPTLAPRDLARLLRTETIDRIFRCISGANNVSIFELSQLPLPNPTSLRAALEEGMPIGDAAELAYRSRSKRNATPIL